MFSRLGHDWTDRVPRIAEALAGAPSHVDHDWGTNREAPLVRASVASNYGAWGVDGLTEQCAIS